MQLNYPVNDLTIAILAGGESSRFGGDAKPLRCISGKPMLEHMLEKALQISDDVHVVIRNDMRAAIQYQGPVYEDLFKGKGPLGGIHAALKRSGRERLLVLPADMPYLKSETLQYFLDKIHAQACDFAYLKAGEKVQPLISIYKNTPELVKVIEQLFASGKTNSVMALLRKTKANQIVLSTKGVEPVEFQNINFPEDLKPDGQNGGNP